MSVANRSRTKITRKQELFINALIAGDSLADAYQQAYPASEKWQKDARTRTAHNLLAREHIKAFYDKKLEEFREEERKKTEWTRQKHIDLLMWNIKHIQEEIERRTSAVLSEAEVIARYQPESSDPAKILVEVQRTLQKPVLSTALTNALVSSAESLSKLLGLYNVDELNSQVIIYEEGELLE